MNKVIEPVVNLPVSFLTVERKGIIEVLWNFILRSKLTPEPRERQVLVRINVSEVIEYGPEERFVQYEVILEPIKDQEVKFIVFFGDRGRWGWFVGTKGSTSSYKFETEGQETIASTNFQVTKLIERLKATLLETAKSHEDKAATKTKESEAELESCERITNLIFAIVF